MHSRTEAHSLVSQQRSENLACVRTHVAGGGRRRGRLGAQTRFLRLPGQPSRDVSFRLRKFGYCAMSRADRRRLGTHPGGWHRRFGDDARRRDRLRRQDSRIFDEEAEHEPIGPGRARRKQARPALLPERLADRLVGRATLPTGCRHRKPNSREPARIGEISYLERPHAMAPDVARKLPQRGTPRSARWRYHSAHKVSSSSAR